MRRKTAVLILSASLSIMASMTAFAGVWLEDAKGWWYQNDDGTYPHNGWEQIGGEYYYFQDDGYVLRSATTPDGYYVGMDGAWIPEGSEEAKRQRIASEKFVDVSKYFNTDLQDFEKAKTLLNVTEYHVEADWCGWYEPFVSADQNVKRLAYRAAYDENRTNEYYEKSSLRIDYDATTNQIICIYGDKELFVDEDIRYASDLKTLAEEAGATDIFYENNDYTRDEWGLIGNTFVPTGRKELVHRDEVSFTWNNLKYSYSYYQNSLRDTSKPYGLIISRK